MNETAAALFDRGARAVDASDYAGAVSTFRQILDLEDVANDYKAMACVNVATVYGDCMGDVDQALAWYQTASELAVKNALFVGSKWVAYLVDKHRYVEAIPILTRLVESPEVGNDDKAMTCVNLATVYDRMGNVDQTLAWYQTGWELAIKNALFVGSSWAAYLIDKHRYVEAIPILTRLVQSADVENDDKAMTCVNLATVYERMGNADQALAWYQTALDLAVEKRRLIERQRAAYLWRRRGRWLGLWLSRFLRA